MIRYMVTVLLSRFANRLNVECKRKQNQGPWLVARGCWLEEARFTGEEGRKQDLCLSHFQFETLPRHPCERSRGHLDVPVCTRRLRACRASPWNSQQTGGFEAMDQHKLTSGRAINGKNTLIEPWGPPTFKV